jgi:hypothetical protein
MQVHLNIGMAEVIPIPSTSTSPITSAAIITRRQTEVMRGVIFRATS